MKSLKTKILIGFIPATIAAMFIMAFVLYFQVKNTTVPMIENSSREIVNAYSGYLGQWIQARTDELGSISQESTVKSMSWKNMKADLENLLKTRTQYEMFFLADRAGNTWDTYDTNASNISDRQYFKDIIDSRAPYVISDALTSQISQKPVFVIAYPVTNNGKTVGVFGATILLSTLQKMVSTVRIGSSGYGWVVDGTGMIAADGNSSLDMRLNILNADSSGYKGMSAIGKKMVNGEGGVGHVTDPNGTKNYFIFTPIPNTPNWSFGVTVTEAHLLRESNGILETIIIIAVIMIAGLAALSVFMGISISKPIKALSEKVIEMGKGDFTVKFVSKSKDEVGRMAQSLDLACANLRDSIGLVAESSNEVNASAGNLAAIAEEMGASSEEVAAQAGTVDGNVQNVSASIEEVNAGIEEMATGTRNVAQTSQELSESTGKVLDSSRAGDAMLDEIAGIVKTATVRMKETSGTMETLSENTQKVEDIVKTISAIAEQTNLLALNAAIEAARAGDAGKGFAVVADETRKLAEESKAETENIARILKMIQEGTRRANESTLRTAETVEKADVLSEKIQENFRTILGQVDGMVAMAEDLASSSEEQSATSQEMTGAMDESTKAVIDAAEQVREIVGVVRQQSASAQDVSASAEELSAISETLVNSVKKFRIK